MDKPKLLWIDLRVNRCHQLSPDLSSLCELYVESQVTNIFETIRQINPQVICFDYDFPSAKRLRALQQTIHMYSSLPILMFTQQHSEALAIWAFRTGVRDFIVKPIDNEIVMRRISVVLEYGASKNKVKRYNFMSQEPTPMETRFTDDAGSEKITAAALSYIESHLAEPLSLATLAKVCGLNRFHFCRAFKAEQGISFRDYLVHCRVEKAKDLLANPQVTVTDVAFIVGFNDPSHFARMFKRYVGCTPSNYRETRSA